MENNNGFPICDRCKKEIDVPAYVLIWPSLILQKVFTPTPPIFSCVEHAENFSHTLKFHDNCWIEVLKDYGIVLHDLKEVAKKHLEKQLEEINKKEGE